MQPTSVARVLRPAVAGREATCPDPHLRFDRALTLVVGHDRVASEDVAAAFAREGRLADTVWLRLEQLDTGPACLAESLIRAADYAKMLDAPPPTPPGTAVACGSSADVGRSLASITRDDVVLVLEDDQPGADTSSIVSTVGTYLEHADTGARVVYISHRTLQPEWGRTDGTVIDGPSPPAALDTAIDFDHRCTTEALRRLATIVGPRSALIKDIVDATTLRDRELLAHLTDRTTRRRSLLRRINAQLISQASPAEVQALTIAAQTGYWHPSLSDRVPPDAMTLRPWMVRLEQDWWWLRPMWRRSLVRILEPARPSAARRLARRVRSKRRPTSLGAGSAHAPAEPAITTKPTSPDHPPAGNGERPDAAAGVGNDDARRATSETTEVPRPHIEVALFGVFELSIDGVAVPRWHGRLGPSILAYLLLQRRCVARDRLVEVFWPDVEPRTAQNRLRVAVSSLRRRLAAASPLPVVECANGNYRVARDGRITLDIDEFQRFATLGRRAEESNDAVDALASYRRALDLYRGELLAELPYEEWTMLPREALRVAYLDCLANASQLHLGLGDHSEALNLAWRILDADPAREDAHQVIMRCHAAQGCLLQVRRQFDMCRHELTTALGVEPATDTIELMRSLEADRSKPSVQR